MTEDLPADGTQIPIQIFWHRKNSKITAGNSSLWGQLSTAETFYNGSKIGVNKVQAAQLPSQHYNYTALMIQLYCRVRSHMTPPVTRCCHSRQMSKTRNGPCVMSGKCREEWINAALAVTQTWRSGKPITTWMSSQRSRPETRLACWREQSMLDKSRQLAGETSHYAGGVRHCVAYNRANKRLCCLLQPVGYFLFCGAFVMDNCSPHMIS